MLECAGGARHLALARRDAHGGADGGDGQLPGERGAAGELAGVPVNTKQVERTGEALGREIADDERAVVDPAGPSAPTMYLGLDGTGVPMRAAELVGRQGKQPDGSAKTREVKLVTVWTAEGRDDDGTPARDAGSVTYSAAIESAATRDTDAAPSEFAQRVDREARRRDFDQARRRAVLPDGAAWIWNLADEQFPGAFQIVDLFHAKQKLSDVAKHVYGPKTTLCAQWATQRHDELDEGKIDAVLAAVGVHAQTNDEARKALDATRTSGSAGQRRRQPGPDEFISQICRAPNHARAVECSRLRS